LALSDEEHDKRADRGSARSRVVPRKVFYRDVRWRGQAGRGLMLNARSKRDRDLGARNLDAAWGVRCRGGKCPRRPPRFLEVPRVGAEGFGVAFNGLRCACHDANSGWARCYDRNPVCG